MDPTRQERTRTYRGLYIVGVPSIALACVGAMTYVLAATGDAIVATPLMFVAMSLIKRTGWIMLWLSTPGERKILRPLLESQTGAVPTNLRTWIPARNRNVSLEPHSTDEPTNMNRVERVAKSA